MPLTSAPEQKSPPAPVITTARSLGDAAIVRSSAWNSFHICPLMAFFRSGRRNVIVTMPLARETEMASRSRDSDVSVSTVMFGDDTEPHGVQPVPEVQGQTCGLRPRGHRHARGAGPRRVGLHRLKNSAASERCFDHLHLDADDGDDVETQFGGMDVVIAQPLQRQPPYSALLARVD